jgi:hypothetical protein
MHSKNNHMTLIKNQFSLKIQEDILQTISDSPIYLVLTVVSTVVVVMEVLFLFA